MYVWMCVCVCVRVCVCVNTKKCSVIREPTQGSSRCVLSLKDSQVLLTTEW